MEEYWGRLEEWVEKNAPKCASSLRPPATVAEVDDAEAELGVEFPPSVRQSYLVHDGEEAAHWGVLGCRLLPLADVVERATELRAIDEGFDYDFWDDSLIPLLDVGNGDYLCVSDAPNGDETPLLRWDHENSNRNEFEQSFAAYAGTVLDAYRAGDYSYDANSERLQVDVPLR